MKERILTGIMCFVFTALFPFQVQAGVPDITDVMVTDVTPNSFSVIWATSEPCTAAIAVYLDQSGTVQATSARITVHPLESGNGSIRTRAEDAGVMKVRVSGLSANTSYYFRTSSTSKSTGDITYYPASTLAEVATEALTERTIGAAGSEVPFSNDLIAEPCYLSDGSSPAIGTLLVATVTGCHYPVTAFVGDGIDAPYALIDLNNMYGENTFRNLNLSTRENLTLVNFRGMLGNTMITYRVPVDASLCEAKEGDFALNSGWNMTSIQLDPDDTDLQVVLGPVMDRLVSIWAYDTDQGKWVFFDKNGAQFLNRLEDLHGAQGFCIMMEGQSSLPVNGGFHRDPVLLKNGWNLVGYRSIMSVPVAQAVEPISRYLNSIWTFDTEQNRWLYYDGQGAPVSNRLTHVEPGRAYWVYVTQECTW